MNEIDQTVGGVPAEVLAAGDETRRSILPSGLARVKGWQRELRAMRSEIQSSLNGTRSVIRCGAEADEAIDCVEAALDLLELMALRGQK